MMAPTPGFGAGMGQCNAFYIRLGVEDLPVRMPRHAENSVPAAVFPDGHDAVPWLTYPSLPSHPALALPTTVTATA